MGGATPGLVVLEFIRKQIEQANKHHSAMARTSPPTSECLPCLSPVLTFLSAVEVETKYTNPFLPSWLRPWVLYHINSNPN